MTNNTIKPVRSWTPYELNQLAKNHLGSLVDSEFSEVPVEYLTGQVDFCGWILNVAPAVLIPRLETEQLVEMAEEFLLKQPQNLSTLVEVGTGSGAIGLSLWRKLVQKRQFRNIQFFLTDVSQEALTVAQRNLVTVINETAEFSKDAIYPKLVQANLLESWPAESKIDLLVANLPYIPSLRLAKLPESVKNFEPMLALDGGADGLELINKLLFQAIELLAVQGKVLLEVDETHTLEQFRLLRPEFDYQGILDCFGKFRFVIASLRH